MIGVIYSWVLYTADLDMTQFVRPDKPGQFSEGVTLNLLEEHKRYLPTFFQN